MEVIGIKSVTCGVHLVGRREGVRDVLALKGGIIALKDVHG